MRRESWKSIKSQPLEMNDGYLYETSWGNLFFFFFFFCQSMFKVKSSIHRQKKMYLKEFFYETYLQERLLFLYVCVEMGEGGYTVRLNMCP